MVNMRSIFFGSLVPAVLAAQPWLNEVDTGLETYLNDSSNYTYSHTADGGTLPDLGDITGLPDFDWAARQYLSDEDYAFYRVAAGGEWSYRNNLDVWSKVRLRPRQLNDVSQANATLPVTFLGYNFSAPIFIAPAARAGYCDEDRAELNFVDAAASEEILYVNALYATKTIEEIGAQKAMHNDTLNGAQVTFQQLYYLGNKTEFWENIERAEKINSKAIVWTIDAPSDSTRQRASRYDTAQTRITTEPLTWDLYEEMRNHTSLPIILKGITTVEDAQTAVEKGVDAIYISNHGGRQLEYSPSPLQTAYEIYRNAPEVFQQIPVMADSGVRYGTDVLKLLALGVKMVGVGRP